MYFLFLFLSVSLQPFRCENIMTCPMREIGSGSNHCPYDWLAVYDGRDEHAPLIGKFCGVGKFPYSIIGEWISFRFFFCSLLVCLGGVTLSLFYASGKCLFWLPLFPNFRFCSLFFCLLFEPWVFRYSAHFALFGYFENIFFL